MKPIGHSLVDLPMLRSVSAEGACLTGSSPVLLSVESAGGWLKNSSSSSSEDSSSVPALAPGEVRTG